IAEHSATRIMQRIFPSPAQHPRIADPPQPPCGWSRRLVTARDAWCFLPDAPLPRLLSRRLVRAMTGPADHDEEPDEGDGDDGDALPVPRGAAHHAFTVAPERAGERIDALIAAIIPALSRASVQRLIDGAQVRLNGAVVGKPGQRVRAGDAVEVDVPPAE